MERREGRGEEGREDEGRGGKGEGRERRRIVTSCTT